MGTTGLETAFAAVYTHLVEPGVLDLGLVVDRMTGGGEPLGIPAPRVRAGDEANLVLTDLGAEWEVGEDGYESRSENCCFAGERFRGRVLLTIAAGAVAYRERAFAVVRA
jgi:dihydroorotase